MLKSNPQDAATDIAKALKGIFEKYSFQTRQKVWEGLTKGKGKEEVDKLLVHPKETPISNFQRLRFGDWMRRGQKPGKKSAS